MHEEERRLIRCQGFSLKNLKERVVAVGSTGVHGHAGRLGDAQDILRISHKGYLCRVRIRVRVPVRVKIKCHTKHRVPHAWAGLGTKPFSKVRGTYLSLNGWLVSMSTVGEEVSAFEAIVSRYDGIVDAHCPIRYCLLPVPPRVATELRCDHFKDLPMVPPTLSMRNVREDVRLYVPHLHVHHRKSRIRRKRRISTSYNGYNASLSCTRGDLLTPSSIRYSPRSSGLKAFFFALRTMRIFSDG